ncbi:MAG: hypothetical protein IT258_16410 [Saprospiraceae bacterium]|nr:hypothetical protein [Saprospiraceae bacterium]
MRELEFDVRGFLTPYERIELTIEEFEAIFVKAFDNSSTRFNIFQNYLRFVNDFREEVTPRFTQWLNGSFVSKKENPGDLDLVTLLDAETALLKDAIIESKFRNEGAFQYYNLDAYELVVYPEWHKDFIFTKSDQLYWHHWFSMSKFNRAKKRFPKGFVEINFI